MTGTSAGIVLWAPRVCGLLVAGFIALFALDSFDGRRVIDALPAFGVHLLPSLLILAVVAIAWRTPWFGAIAFAGLAIAYGVMVRWRMDWVAAIAGPLVLVAALFLVSWRVTRSPEPN